MPTRPKGRCTFPGCGNRTDRPGRRCSQHQSEYDRAVKVAQPWAGNYGRTWRAIRAQVLEEEPRCRRCGDPAEQVDHITPLRLGGSHERSNLQALCRRCHRKKTLEDIGHGRTRAKAKA